MSVFELPDALLQSEGKLEQARSLSLYGNEDRKQGGDSERVSEWRLSCPRRLRLEEDALLLAGFNEHSAQVWCAGLPSLECFGHGSAMGFGFVDDKRERFFCPSLASGDYRSPDDRDGRGGALVHVHGRNCDRGYDCVGCCGNERSSGGCRYRGPCGGRDVCWPALSTLLAVASAYHLVPFPCQERLLPFPH